MTVELPVNQIVCGDCLEVMRDWPDCCVDTIITDPPYGLGFMGKGWDHGVPGVDSWTAFLRIAKPGAILMAFGGTRTWHRLACAIEDAGWEIRDTIMWVYGQGWPKGQDISKAIDKEAGAERKRIGRKIAADGTMVGRVDGNSKTHEGYQHPWRNKPIEEQPTAWITAPATDAAKLWQGWSTTLKPSWEPIIVASKSIEGTYAQNAVKWGVAGYNIDACRIPANGDRLDGGRVSTTTDGWDRPWKHDDEALRKCRERGDSAVERAESLGRWPANLAHDGSEEVLRLFPQTTSGEIRDGVRAGKRSNHGIYGQMKAVEKFAYHENSGSAARFFYCGKASRSERTCGGKVSNNHPTVKPVSLMRWLVRLTSTPSGGIVLDPFCGSGSTLLACALEGRPWIGIDDDPASCETARKRMMTMRPEDYEGPEIMLPIKEIESGQMVLFDKESRR